MPTPPFSKRAAQVLAKQEGVIEQARREEQENAGLKFWEEYWKSDNWRELEQLGQEKGDAEQSAVEWEDVEKDLL